MKINDFNNKKFDIFGSKWTIKIVDSILTDEPDKAIFGITDISRRTIQVAWNVNDIRQDENEMFTTLLHELMHVFLMEGQYNEANLDEPMIEWVARCIKSLLKQKIL